MGFWSDLVTLLRHGPRVLLAQADEIPGEPVRQWRVGLAGESKANRDGSRRQDVIRRCSEGERVLLVREPDNVHDENAILVCRLDGQCLGYIPADQALDLAADMDNGTKFNAYIEFINGGSKGKKNLGVVVRICLMEKPRAYPR